jgi:hypothetical protein
MTKTNSTQDMYDCRALIIGPRGGRKLHCFPSLAVMMDHIARMAPFDTNRAGGSHVAKVFVRPRGWELSDTPA